MRVRVLSLLSAIIVMVSCNSADNRSEDTASETVAPDVQKDSEENVILPGKHASEDSMMFYLSEIGRTRSEDSYEQLDKANAQLMRFMERLCMDTTALQYSFDSVEAPGMTVLTSDDRKFRIYCWDSETGGTMHFYNAIIQYKKEKGSNFYILNDVSDGTEDGPGDTGYWYSQLHTINTNGGRTYYLPIYFGRYSGIEHAQGISAYEITDDKLNMPLIFKPTGKPLNEILYDYTSGTVDKESAENYISLSDDKKTLSIPVTDNDRVVTKRSLIYKFDGDKFVYDKNAH